MAMDKPAYGGKPIYYSASKRSPVYYGSNAYGAPSYYGGTYGGTPYYYGSKDNQDSDSVVGTITLSRILRVVSQRWISILVFLLIGLVAAFAVYRISPTVYEAKSEFTVQMRSPSRGGGDAFGQMVEVDYGSTYAEVFNTRLSDWRSEKIVKKIIQQYHANFPASTVTEQELSSTLAGSEMELMRNSRLITIAVRSSSPKLAAALANAYAEAIESFTDDENKLRCDKAVAQIHEQVEKQRRVDEKVASEMLDFRTKHRVDQLRGERDILQQSLQKVTTDVLALETEVTAAQEWEKVLEAAQESPEDFGALPTAVPRSTEIGQAYTSLQKCQMELNQLLTTFTKSHPEVRIKQKELDILKKQFTEAVSRALATAHGNLVALRNQLAVHTKKRDTLRGSIVDLEHKIVIAEAGYRRLQSEQDVSSALLKQLQQDENTARIVAEQNNEIVRVGRPATTPSKPVLPDPVIIFSIGAAVSVLLGLLFVLLLDHLEDTVVSLADIETRLSLKVLAVLPHVRRKKREEVAKFIFENRYSQFAEAMAGLRNLLDSPRYHEMSRVVLIMSTQPGEGKTITSCSLAVSNAQAHRRTLLVDFDLRRPRMARVWGLDISKERSFSHCMMNGNFTDFDSLVMPSGVENLDVIGSLSPDGVDPASIMGSKVVTGFFEWARSHYDCVVVDSPPYGLVGDVMTLSTMVDGVMIMCCPDRTHFRSILSSSRNLVETGANVLGVIVNDVEAGSTAFTASGRTYYGSHYNYGYGYGRSNYGPYAPKGGNDAQGGGSSANGLPDVADEI